MSNNGKKDFGISLSLIAVEMLLGAAIVWIFGNNSGEIKKLFEKDKNTGIYDSDLYDSFDINSKQNVKGQYYVLKLRDAYKADCSSDSNEMEKHAYNDYGNIASKSCLWYEQQSQNGAIEYITDASQVPKYLLLTGSDFGLIQNVPEGSIQYSFTGWNENYSNIENWNTEIALLRSAKDDFNIVIWGCEFGLGGQLTLDDSYIVPVSQLTDIEVQELLKQYNNDDKVASILNENRNDDFLDRDYEVLLKEEYYVFDLGMAWDNRKYESVNQVCSLFDTDSNHNCASDSEYSNLKINAPIPRYVLLKTAATKNSVQEADGSFSTYFQNYEWLISDNIHMPQSGISINRNLENNFDIYINHIVVPLSDENKAYYAEQGMNANSVILHGYINTNSSYIKPLSSLTKEEVQSLVAGYGNNGEIVKIVEDVWFSSLLENNQTKIEEPVMSNGLTKSMNEAILREAEIAAVKSKILRKLGK